MAGLVFGALWKGGLIHRTLLRKVYTPVCVEMEMPHSLLASLDLPVKAFFFEDDNDKIPEIPGSTQTLAPADSLRYQDFFKLPKGVIETTRLAAKNKTYDSADVFLKKGDYRVKVVVGPYIWWKSFSVGEEALVLKCDLLRNSTRKLVITPLVYDDETGENITDKASVKILYNNNWIPLSSVNEDELKTGKVWKIRTECEGYQSEYFSLLIDWYQDRLFISSSLKKK